MVDRIANKDGITRTEFLLGKSVVYIETPQNGGQLSVEGRVEDYYKGPLSFDTVVNFGQLFVERGMKESRVPDDLQWSSENPPPQGISILELNDPKVRHTVEEISQIASQEFYGNPYACSSYYDLNQEVFHALSIDNCVHPEDETVIGLVRAGAVAGEMLGVSCQDQVLVQTKRLPLKGDKPGDIGIGITYLEPGRINSLDDASLLIPDPAGATYASVVANLIYLKHSGIKPREVKVWNTVASHKGSMFAQEAMSALGMDGQIAAGGYSPEMNEHYYLVSRSGQPSVRDAGDGLNMFLPDRLRSCQ